MGSDLSSVLHRRHASVHLLKYWSYVADNTGPYGLYNALELIGACAKAGKHYLDLNGDVGMLAADVVPRWDFAASQTGSVIVPMCGFESAPG
jgi:short subunit dehydrogenase-like uncharacterized protein